MTPDMMTSALQRCRGRSLGAREARTLQVCVQARRPSSRALALMDGPGSVLVHTGVGAALLVAIGTSLATPKVTAARAEDNFEVSVRWSVMTVLSLLPYFNFASWAFAAIDSVYEFGGGDSQDAEDGVDGTEGQAMYYWSLAFLYAIPYALDGFQLNEFTLVTIAMGAAHVQVERARYYRTSSDGPLLPGLTFLRGFRLPRFSAGGPKLGSRIKAFGLRGDVENGVEEDEEDEEERMLEEMARNELSDFDRRLQDRG